MRRLNAVIVAMVVAAAVSVGSARVFADDGDEFILVKPKICDTVSWDDWEYWYYSCYTF